MAACSWYLSLGMYKKGWCFVVKRKDTLVICIGIILIGCYVTVFIGQGGSGISEMVTTITAIIGVFAIWLQLKKERELNEAQFIMDYNSSFISNSELVEIESELEKYRKINELRIDESNRQAFINYLVYNEALAALVFRNVLTLDVIDDLFSYRFFLAMNNPILQKEEIIPEAEYYKGSIKLYEKWVNYKIKNRLPIVLEQYRLDKVWDGFNQYLK